MLILFSHRKIFSVALVSVALASNHITQEPCDNLSLCCNVVEQYRTAVAVNGFASDVGCFLQTGREAIRVRVRPTGGRLSDTNAVVLADGLEGIGVASVVSENVFFCRCNLKVAGHFGHACEKKKRLSPLTMKRIDFTIFFAQDDNTNLIDQRFEGFSIRFSTPVRITGVRLSSFNARGPNGAEVSLIFRLLQQT